MEEDDYSLVENVESVLNDGKFLKATNNFRNLTSKYNGIEICPYLWSKRMRSNWYYPWDVASGCIWDGRGLFSAELLVEKSAKVSEDDWAKKEKERMDKIMADSDKNRAKADAAKARLAAGWEKYRYDPQTGEKLF